MLPGEEIVATGLGAISSVGEGCDALWEAVAAGRDGIREVDRFSTAEFSVHLAALVPDAPPAKKPEDHYAELCIHFAVTAAREALAQAKVPPGLRVALVFGTGLGDRGEGINLLAEAVADQLELSGPRLSISTACTSSTNALGLGADLLRAGFADVVVAGGSDVVTPELFAGFHALGVLSKEKCAPFSVPNGTTLGEGAGFLVLEAASAAKARGAEALAALLGYGLSSDGYHETSPDPTGAGVARAIRGALGDAGLEPEAIGYVNTHGTGTAANDPAEWRALCSVFGDRARALPVSSTKGHLGHAQGAAGVLEVIVALLAMRRGLVPPTLHYTRPRAIGPADPIGQATPRVHPPGFVLSTNSAFAGANAAVVFAPSGQPPRRARARTVTVAGAGAVGPHGLELAAWMRSVSSEAAGRRVPDFGLEKLAPTTDPRGLDPSARFLIGAAAKALEDAGAKVHGAARDRSGILVAASRVSRQSAAAFDSSVERRGLPLLASAAFARMVLNAPAGTCATALGLKGPTSTLVTGEGGGLAAIVYAVNLLASRADADLLLAGGFDEIDAETAAPFAEGAGLLALSAGAIVPPRDGPVVRAAGWALAGPGDFAGAVRQALAQAGLSASELDAVYGVDRAALGFSPRHLERCDRPGRFEAAGASLAAVTATVALRRGLHQTALIGASTGRSVCAALILTTRSPDVA